MQNYFSFIASYQSFEKLVFKANKLPHETTEMVLYSFEDFRLLMFISDNPLYEHHFYKNNQGYAIFLNGFFYDVIDPAFFNTFQNLNSINSEDFSKAINTLNGNFNGLIINGITKEITCFTDIFGYQKIFYTYEENHIIISSFVWPLLERNPSLDPFSINEFITLGFSLGNKNLIKNVFYLKPGVLSTLQENSFKLNEFYYERYPISSLNKSKEHYAIEFLDYINEFVNYLEKKIPSEAQYITLTGGGDSRVILNSLINIRKYPICITGSAPKIDQLRSKKITRLLNLKYIPVNYSNELLYNFEAVKAILIITNGLNNGLQMSQIAIAPDINNSFLFYGFSGDLLSGSMPFDLNHINFENLPNTLFPVIAQYKGVNFQALPRLLGYSENSVKDSFVNIFNSYRKFSLEDAYYLIQKNEHDYKRIGSFADGSKIGNSIPINLFHNRKIIDFYRSLPPDFKYNESFHNYLGYYNNLKLGLIGSSGRSNIPVFLLPLLLNSISKERLIFWAKVFRKKKSISIQKKINFNFLEKLQNDWDILGQFVDTSELIKLIEIGNFEPYDLQILHLRILNIVQLYKFLKQTNSSRVTVILRPQTIKTVEYYQSNPK